MANKTLHRAAIPLRSIAAGELDRSAPKETIIIEKEEIFEECKLKLSKRLSEPKIPKLSAGKGGKP